MNFERFAAVALTLLVGCLIGCRTQTEESAAPPAESAAVAPPTGLVEVIAAEESPDDFAFVAPARVASGWTTFRMTNTGKQPHLMILWKLPEQVAFDEYAEFGRMFQNEYDRYVSGEATQDEMIGGVVSGLPEWFGELRGMGGVALTSPGVTAETTVRLEPGNYVMECYVVTPEGDFHGTLGMLRPLIVTGETTGLEPPEADVRVTLSNYEMKVDDEPSAGEQVIAVHATEDAEGIILHDVNLARLSADASLEEVGVWMSWIDALRTPAPAEFLGGADHLSGGSTSYFRVNLEPGRYAFVSEGFATKGMVHEFTVE